jgi:mannose-6-phosphate isomerase-like protein (cupin superfamily)
MKPTVVRLQDAPRFTVEGAEVTAYASPSRGSQALATWRLSLAAGAGSPLHTLEVDEVFLALAGAAEFHAAGEVLRVEAGDGITVPANTEFRIVSVGAVAFEAAVSVPASIRARIGSGAAFVPPWAA